MRIPALALMFIEFVPDPLDRVFQRLARHRIGREFPTADAASGCNAWNLNVEVLKVEIPSRPQSRPPQSRPLSLSPWPFDPVVAEFRDHQERDTDSTDSNKVVHPTTLLYSDSGDNPYSLTASRKTHLLHFQREATAE